MTARLQIPINNAKSDERYLHQLQFSIIINCFTFETIPDVVSMF